MNIEFEVGIEWWLIFENRFQIFLDRNLALNLKKSFVLTELLGKVSVASHEIELTLSGLDFMHLSYLLSRTDADLDRRRFCESEFRPEMIELTPDEPEVRVTSFKISIDARVLIEPPIPTVWSLNIFKDSFVFF